MRHSYFDAPLPHVLGHRGAAGERPENTLASFARALEVGAGYLESDLHATRDGVVVMIHDDTVDRTTDGTGVVADLTHAELCRLDAGHRFSPDGRGFPYRGRGLRVPTLEEAFREFPDARFNLELKHDAPGFVERTVELVAKHDRADRTLLTTERPPLMERLRRVLADTGVSVAVGASSADVLGFVRAALEEHPSPPSDSMALQVPAAFLGRPLVTPELAAYAHAHDVLVHVWTVNDPDEMHRLLDLGVDGLVTDLPGRMVELVAERHRRGRQGRGRS